MSRAVLSLGSNVGDREAYLGGALERLAPWLRATSGRYETAPWGVLDQADFLNLVAVVEDDAAGPWDWWERARDCERAAARVRGRRWGPRRLDVDVVCVREAGTAVTSNDPELTLPHPRCHERAFVLVPWAELEPDAVVAGHGPVAALLAALPPAERDGVRRVEGSP